ncbi:MAG: hypothetical protein ACREA9_04485 [Pyrinomonadaceae bacterium]
MVQADNLSTGLPQVIVAMITSQITRAGHPSRVSIIAKSEQGKQSGLLTDSVVMTATSPPSSRARCIALLDIYR